MAVSASPVRNRETIIAELRNASTQNSAYGVWLSGQMDLYQAWLQSGRPVPPPHFVKQLTVRQEALRSHLRVFVETGTQTGGMVYAVRDLFDDIHSIELSPELYRQAQEKFAREKHVTLWQGDSGEVLAVVLARVSRPCLFWLDAHYSGGRTAKGDSTTPVRKELAHILNHLLVRQHVILIDDARCFTGEGDYPSLHALHDWATVAGFNNFEVAEDIIRIGG